MDDLMNWKIKEYPIKQLATGETLSIKTFTVTGQKPGPHIHLQASVHGAELQGNAVLLKLMEVLPKYDLQGSITFVPICNPYATNQKVGAYTYGRFNPVTGHNWNRNFFDVIERTQFDFSDFVQKHKDSTWEVIKQEYKALLTNLYEQHEQKLDKQKRLSDNIRLNLLLQKLASSADGILDMHTGPVATRYLYSAEYQEDVAPILLFKHILVIPNEFGGAMDESCFMPWIHLQKAFSQAGRDIKLDVESFTLEFGSEETFSMDWAGKDVESVLNYLAYKGLIKENVKKNEPYYCKLSNYKTLYSPIGGLVDYRKKPGDHFKANETLANFYQLKDIDPENPIESCRLELNATEDGIIINSCPSSSVHQGMELFQIMTNLYR